MRPLTLAEYRALEAAGKLKRPLTDPPIGATTTAQRVQDARNSEHVTNHGPTPQPRKENAR